MFKEQALTQPVGRPTQSLAWLAFLYLALGGALAACRMNNAAPEASSTPVGTALVRTAPASDPYDPARATMSPVPERQLTPTTLSQLPALTPSPTFVPPPSPTPEPWSERWVLGYSAQGRAIETIRLGNGPFGFVILAAIHGAHECNTNQLAEGIVGRLLLEPDLLPSTNSLYVVPAVNPDGCALDSRHNANGVDLNRNWNTDDWTADAEGPDGLIVGSGGTHPFSEPETALLSGWLLELRQRFPAETIRLISYHSAVPETGLAQPAYTRDGQPEPASGELAMAYAEATGYRYSPVWVGAYTITGELIYWAAGKGFVAIDVELPDRQSPDLVPAGWSETHLETTLRGLLTVFALPER